MPARMCTDLRAPTVSAGRETNAVVYRRLTTPRHRPRGRDWHGPIIDMAIRSNVAESPTQEEREISVRRRNGHRGLMFGFSVLAGVLALVSVAYACTVYKGVVSIYGDASSNHSSKTGDPRYVMVYCETGHNHEGAAAYRQGGNDAGADFTLYVDPSSACGGSKLNADNYDLMILGNGSDPFNADGSWKIDCMNNGTWTHRFANAVPVDSGGYGKVSVDLTNSSLKAGPGAVCVADDGDYEGNQVPIDWL